MVTNQDGLGTPANPQDVFDQFQTGYVPTTVFIDSEGDQVGETAIGSRSYSDWEALVLELLS